MEIYDNTLKQAQYIDLTHAFSPTIRRTGTSTTQPSATCPRPSTFRRWVGWAGRSAIVTPRTHSKRPGFTKKRECVVPHRWRNITTGTHSVFNNNNYQTPCLH